MKLRPDLQSILIVIAASVFSGLMIAGGIRCFSDFLYPQDVVLHRWLYVLVLTFPWSLLVAVVLTFLVCRRTLKEQSQQSLSSDFDAIMNQAFVNAHNGMALIDASGDVVKWNRKFSGLMKIGKFKHKLSMLTRTQDDGDDFLAQFHHMQAGKLTQYDTELHCTNLEGEPLSVVMHMTVVPDAGGDFRYAFVQCQDISKFHQLSAELEHQARHDELTALPNRRVLNEALALLAKDNRNKYHNHALCVLDLDQFKTVNDTAGHLAGDELLRVVVQAIQKRIRKDDLLVRMGGDEFALILYHCSSNESLRITESIRKAIEDIHFQWESNVFRISTSIGVIATDQSWYGASNLLQKADSACFAAKEAGRNRVYLVDEKDTSILEREGQMRCVHRLHEALEQDYFCLYAQPMLGLTADNQTQYAEVLLRMHEGEGGVVMPPGAFLPAAERFGLMVKIDQWVIKTLLKNIVHYQQLFGTERRYWVNLSGASVSDTEFWTFLEQEMQNAGLPANCLNFEITETSAINNITFVKEKIRRLKALGCQFSLDHFGAGLSSFRYLQELPVDYLKIDGAFIKDVHVNTVNQSIVKSIIDIAAIMNVKTVAECVESVEILEKIRSMGADYAQGYQIARATELKRQDKKEQAATIENPTVCA